MTLKITKRMLELNYHTSKMGYKREDNAYKFEYRPINQPHYGTTIYYYEIAHNQITITHCEIDYCDINEDINHTFDLDISEIIENEYQHVQYLSMLFSILANAVYDVKSHNIYKKSLDEIVFNYLTTQDNNEYIPNQSAYRRYILNMIVTNDDIRFLYGQEHLVPHTILVKVYNHLITKEDDPLAKFHNESIKILKQRIIDEKPEVHIDAIPIDIDCTLINHRTVFTWSNNEQE